MVFTSFPLLEQVAIAHQPLVDLLRQLAMLEELLLMQVGILDLRNLLALHFQVDQMLKPLERLLQELKLELELMLQEPMLSRDHHLDFLLEQGLALLLPR